MRPLALILRAGAVVVALGFLFSLLIDGAPRPVAAGVEAAGASTRRRGGGEAAARKAPPPGRPPRGAGRAPQGVVTISAVGDIVMGSTPNLPPDGGRSFFDGVQTDLAADVVLGNLEGTLSVGGGSKCGAGSSNCYAFQTPAVVRGVAEEGRLHGPEPRQQPCLRLRAAPARRRRSRPWASSDSRPPAGPARSPTSRSATIDVALVGFAPYPWAQSLTDIPAARRLVKKAAAHADVVIVTMHAGAEGSDRMHVRPGTEMFLGENRGNVVAFSHAVVEAGADVVIGSGPHVLRGMEWYHGRLIAYSLGNFAGYRVFALGGPLSISGILRVTLRGDGGFDSGTLVPTRMVGSGVPALDPPRAPTGSCGRCRGRTSARARSRCRRTAPSRRPSAGQSLRQGLPMRNTQPGRAGLAPTTQPSGRVTCASSTWW